MAEIFPDFSSPSSYKDVTNKASISTPAEPAPKAPRDKGGISDTYSQVTYQPGSSSKSE